MLGPADLEAWYDDLGGDLVADLVAAGWREAAPPAGLGRRRRDLFDRFRRGDGLSFDELADLTDALRRQ